MAHVEMLDRAETAIDHDQMRRAAIAALQAVIDQLRGVPDVSSAIALMLPHMHFLPPNVQQRVLETDDPADWISELTRVLPQLEP